MERTKDDKADRRIRFIEFHDAKMEFLELHLGGKLTLEFAHLVVYVAVAEDREEVWSYRGRLHVDAVREIQLHGPLADDDYVMDAVLRADGRELEEVALLDGHRLEQLRLTFFFGASLEVACTAARLELTQEVRHMGNWPPPGAESK